MTLPTGTSPFTDFYLFTDPDERSRGNHLRALTMEQAIRSRWAKCDAVLEESLHLGRSKGEKT